MEVKLEGSEELTIIDWNTSQEEFRKQISQMIGKLTALGKVIPLPVPFALKATGPGLLGMLASMVNCNQCLSSLCCKVDVPGGIGIEVTPADRKRLEHIGVERYVRTKGDKQALDYPCHFLNDKGKCSFYRERPIVCVMYPFQPGGSIGPDKIPAVSVASSCPEGRRIAKLIYMNTWRIMGRLKDEEIVFEGLNA